MLAIASFTSVNPCVRAHTNFNVATMKIITADAAGGRLAAMAVDTAFSTAPTYTARPMRSPTSSRTRLGRSLPTAVSLSGAANASWDRYSFHFSFPNSISHVRFSCSYHLIATRLLISGTPAHRIHISLYFLQAFAIASFSELRTHFLFSDFALFYSQR